jgi:hypothetical protein
MGKRGRTSAAELSVASVAPVETLQRPDAPYDLTDEQAEEWWAVVNRMPADWFPRETHGMLAQYCRHVVAARKIAQMLETVEVELAAEVEENRKAGKAHAKTLALLAAAKTIDRLLKMQEREGRAISSLATRMRLTQQATYDKSKKKPLETKKPWET